MMNTFFTNRFFIATMSLFLGASSMWAYDKIKSTPEPVVPNPQNFYTDFMSTKNDPFEQISRLHQKFFQNFMKEDSWPNVFEDHGSFTFNDMKSTQITRREDQQNVYYDLDLGGQKAKEFNVTVKDGQINIFGKIERAANDEASQSYFQSSFQRSFPAPLDVDAEKFKVTEENQKIVIILPKKASI